MRRRTYEKESLIFHNTGHIASMILWRGVGRKYHLNQARRHWREIVAILGGLG